jgi:hypothetical protein
LPSGTGLPVSDYNVIQLTPATVADVWTNSTGSANTATPGQTYTATANIKRTLNSTANGYIRIDWKKSDGSSNGDTGATNILSINNSSWTQLSVSASAPANTAYAIVVINATPISTTDYIYVKSATFAGNPVETSRFIAGTNTSISLTYLSYSNFGYTMTVDGNKGGAWMKTFYEANLFKPVRVRIIHSKDVGPGLSASAYTASSFFPSPYMTASGALTKVGGYEEFWAFIDDFSYDVVKRYSLTDIVNISMSFVEI